MDIRDKPLRIIIVGAFIAGSLLFLYVVRGILYPFVAAILIAYILNPAVENICRKGVRRVTAIFIVYAFLFTILTFVGIYLVPLVFAELERFAANVPVIAERFQTLVRALQARYNSAFLPPGLRQVGDEVIRNGEEAVLQTIRGALAGMIVFFKHLVGFAISPILAFYILKDWAALKQGLANLVPLAWRRDCFALAAEVDAVLSGVIRGQLLVAVFVGMMVTAGLWLLKVDFAVIVGILAGLLDIIPYFGAVIGALPALALALLTSPWLALKVAVLFLVVHQLEGTVIAPHVFGQSVGLHPLTVIFVLLVGGELFGLKGMLLAVPVTAVLKVVARHLVAKLW